MRMDPIDMLRYGGAPASIINQAQIYLNIANEKIKEDKGKQYEHTIMFVPVCGKCGKLIKDTINVEPEGFLSKVAPCYCRECGTYFNSIIMPGKFPFNVFEGYFGDEDE